MGLSPKEMSFVVNNFTNILPSGRTLVEDTHSHEAPI